MKHRAIAVLALILLAPPVLAEEVRLKDGRTLYGKVTQDQGTLTVATRDGAVQVALSEVASRTSDAELRRKLRQLASEREDSPLLRLQLATIARTQGLEPEMWEHLDALWAFDSDRRAPLQRRIDEFLGQLEPDLLAPRFAAAPAETRVRELIKGHSKTESEGRREARLELLRRAPNADKDLRQEARAQRTPAARVLAMAALAGRSTAGNDAFLWRTAILDRDLAVRQSAMQLARDYDKAKGAVEYLRRGLMHESADVRVRTAEALAELGDESAMEPIVAAGPLAGARLAAGSGQPGARAHVAFLEQQSYLRDFDVEVASSSFIGDPQTDVLQSGTVLDVEVHSVVAERIRIQKAYRRALQRLGGSDPGPDPKVWASWLLRLAPKAAPTTPGATPPAPTTPAPTKPAGTRPDAGGRRLQRG